MNEPQRIGTFSFHQDDIAKLRLAQKEVIMNEAVSWRIGFESRPLRNFVIDSNSDTKSDSSIKIDESVFKQSTPRRKRPAQIPQESLSKTVRKKLHLQKNL